MNHTKDSCNGRSSRLKDDLAGLGLRASVLGPLILEFARITTLRPLVRWLLGRLEGGIMRSLSLRELYRRWDGITIGSMSRGAGIGPGVFPRGTVIGAFCSFARGLEVLGRNHPCHRISQHPLFFNEKLGLVRSDTILSSSACALRIGNDVWTGLNVIICPGCKQIGDGAIIGAGSVVTRDVEPFTIVAGNPARLIRRRFSPDEQTVVSRSRWWEADLQKLVEHRELFERDLDQDVLDRFESVFPGLTE